MQGLTESVCLFLYTNCLSLQAAVAVTTDLFKDTINIIYSISNNMEYCIT